MKNLLSFILIMCTSSLWAQVPDSTFGEPLSYGGGSIFYGVTLSAYTGVHDRAFASIHLDDGRILLGGPYFWPHGGRLYAHPIAARRQIRLQRRAQWSHAH